MFVALRWWTARRALQATVLLGCAAQALAMQLDRTRLIIQEADGHAIIQAHSENALPLLLQAWIDSGQTDRPDAASALSDVPFMTAPPVARLDPGTSRAIQVWLTHAPETLPAERESLYWLNVLQIPATASGEVGAPSRRLHVSVQTRLKLFYRPRALAHYDAAALAPNDRLHFALERDAAGLAWLRVHNPAPIHQTLATLTLHLPDAAAISLDASMLAPLEERRLPLPQAAIDIGLREVTTARIVFAVIDDDGNVIEDEQALSVRKTIPSPTREQQP